MANARAESGKSQVESKDYPAKEFKLIPADPVILSRYGELFKEAKQIRRCNTADAVIVDQINLYLLRGIFTILVAEKDFLNSVKSQNFNKTELRYFLSGSMAKHFNVGNCFEHHCFAGCKILMAGFNGYVEFFGYNGKDLKTMSPDSHCFVLQGHNDKCENGSLFDSWNLDEIVKNPGIKQIAMSCGMEFDLPPVEVFKVTSNYTSEQWQNVAMYFLRAKQYLTHEYYKDKMNLIFTKVLVSLAGDIGMKRAIASSPLIMEILENFKVSELHSTFEKWEKDCRFLALNPRTKEEPVKLASTTSSPSLFTVDLSGAEILQKALDQNPSMCALAPLDVSRPTASLESPFKSGDLRKLNLSVCRQ